MPPKPNDNPEDESLPPERRRNRAKRWLAFGLLAFPFALAFPLRYWAMNYAGSWFVSSDLEPDHRRAFLGLMYLGFMAAIAVWSFFGASVLLWLDRFHPVISAFAAILFGLLAIPAGVFLAIGVSSYFRFN